MKENVGIHDEIIEAESCKYNWKVKMCGPFYPILLNLASKLKNVYTSDYSESLHFLVLV